MNTADFWILAAGLGLFLYGMLLLEHVLKKMSGRPFKLFLRNYTQKLWKAITGGAIVTAVLQSSSIVSLMILAFVEAGIISFSNGLGVILGSNFGTTISSWIVATAGFRTNIESFALPVVSLSAIIMFFSRKRKKIFNSFRLIFAVGILFLGIGFMKEGAMQLVRDNDLTTFGHYNILLFVLTGFVLTTLIQSSSATVAITLTALYAGALTFPGAAAIVIGSEAGTSVKILLAGLSGSAEKKRVGFSNFIFNIATSLIALVLLPVLIWFIEDLIRIGDPLIRLVFFQSTINLLSIILFVPFFGSFARWMGKRFGKEEKVHFLSITKDLPLVPELTFRTMQSEAENILLKTMDFNNSVFSLKNEPVKEGIMKNIHSFTKKSGAIEQQYDRLKQSEGDILDYFIRSRMEEPDKTEYEIINHFVSCVHQSLHAAKSVKDIRHNLKEFRSSANDLLYDYFRQLQQDWSDFDASIRTLMKQGDNEQLRSDLKEVMNKAFRLHNVAIESVDNYLRLGQVKEMDAATLLNVRREILSAKKALLRAIAHLRLKSAEAYDFEYAPFHL